MSFQKILTKNARWAKQNDRKHERQLVYQRISRWKDVNQKSRRLKITGSMGSRTNQSEDKISEQEDNDAFKTNYSNIP